MSTELDSDWRLYYRRLNLTMFPGSVDPRAKIKDAGRQGLSLKIDGCFTLILSSLEAGNILDGVAEDWSCGDSVEDCSDGSELKLHFELEEQLLGDESFVDVGNG